MKLIVGLGNPGQEYIQTRHNVGFRVVEALAREWGLSWQTNKRLKAKTAKKEGVVLAKPLVFMNQSGRAVRKLVDFYNLEELADLWVVHDDLDLELGKMKLSQARGAAGHHGVESVIKYLGNKGFIRLRIGIGPAQGEPTEFVLSRFLKKQEEEVKRIIKKAVKALQKALESGRSGGI